MWVCTVNSFSFIYSLALKPRVYKWSLTPPNPPPPPHPPTSPTQLKYKLYGSIRFILVQIECIPIPMYTVVQRVWTGCSTEIYRFNNVRAGGWFCWGLQYYVFRWYRVVTYVIYNTGIFISSRHMSGDRRSTSGMAKQIRGDGTHRACLIMADILTQFYFASILAPWSGSKAGTSARYFMETLSCLI